MIQTFEDYVNSFPFWYSWWTVPVGMACALCFSWSLADLGRFDTRYFLWKAIRAALACILCALIWAWPIPVFWWGLRRVYLGFMGIHSELDEMIAFDKRKSK